ncbi:MAG: hypothetical protein DSZ07_00005 [Sulfurovum sp.]|nr:MAG: hypothetical protein DSZ07_00005 [Sulfurovum sp.]
MSVTKKYNTLKTNIEKQQFMREVLESCDDMFPHTHSKEWNEIEKILMDDKEIHRIMLENYTKTNDFPLSGYLRWIYSVNVAPEKLAKAIGTKDKKLLDEVFYGLEEKYFPHYLETMDALLLEDWHSFYYDIILELQRMKSPKSIEPLYQFLCKNRENDLGNRVVWALADIGTSRAKKKLEMLLEYDDIKAKELIKKRLKLWECERDRKAMNPLMEGWYLTDEEDDPYTKELYIELSEGHELYGQHLRVIAHQDRVHDDVLCKHLEQEDYYSMVHLTWSQRAELEAYPTHDTGLTWEDFLNN